MYNHSALNIVNKGYWVIQAFPQMNNQNVRLLKNLVSVKQRCITKKQRY